MLETNDRIAALSPAKRALLERKLKEKKPVANAPAAIPRVPGQGPARLSFAQERLWFMEQLQPGSAVYNIPFTLRFSGELDVAALERCINEILRRHESLRTRFAEVEGQPVQIVEPFAPIDLPVVDCAGDEAAAARLCSEEARRPFDLAGGIMLRARLFRLAPAEHILFVNMHHIASDNWSLGVFVRELAALYEAFAKGLPSPLPELPVQYVDFAAWQRDWLRGEVLEKQLSYWREQLRDAPTLLELPADRPRPATPSFRGATLTEDLPAPLSLALNELSRREGVTPFMTLLTAFQMLLSRYTGREDILTGSVIAGRNRTEAEPMIGFFVNTIVLRTKLPDDPSFRTLIRQVREVSMRAWAHQDLPFETLVRELHPRRDMSHSPIFQVMFVFKTAMGETLNLPGLRVGSPEIVDHGASDFDLALSIGEGRDSLRAELQYSTDLFDEPTARRMLGHYRMLLDGIVSDPNRPLSALPLLTDAERSRMLTEWNPGRAWSSNDLCAHEIIEEWTERTPEAVAVSDGDTQLTYGELNARANRLAAWLQDRGVGPEIMVGLCVERSPEMIVAILAILKAGGAYVAIDPALPPERIRFMLDDTGASLVLTQRSQLESLPEDATARTQCLDEFDWAAGSGENLVNRAAPGNLAYVIYTSGSTGQPKGVMIEHRALVNFIRAATEGYYPVSPEDRVLQFASISFDVSVEEIFCTLARGAALFLRTEEMAASLDALIEKCRQWNLTVMSLPTAFWHELVRHMEETGNALPESLRLVAIGGEAASPEHVARWRRLTQTALVNCYGPTESTVSATVWPAEADKSGTVPIGRPLANTEAYILDRKLQPVPPGIPGELHIGGASLARGYLKRPELTAAKFISHPFSEEPHARLYRTGDLARFRADGNIEFLGRVDHQVKIRGFRVELGEIESQLRAHPSVNNCVVVIDEPAAGEKRLLAYFVPRGDVKARELRDFLAAKLPEYMIPAAFVPVETLSLNSSGKVDRKNLPAADAPAAEGYVAPQGWLQVQLVEIWEELLGARPIGVKDNFFERGGHSLLAIRMCSRVEKLLGRKLPPAALFQEPTIEHVSRVLSQGGGGERASELIKVRAQGSKPPLFFFHGDFQAGGPYCIKLAKYLPDDRPFYTIHPHGFDGADAPETIEEMAASRLETILRVQPEGPYFLGGYCNGAFVAFEAARQLRAQGREVACVVLLSANGTNARFQRLKKLARLAARMRGLNERAERDLYLKWRAHFFLGRALMEHHFREMKTGGRPAAAVMTGKAARFLGWLARSVFIRPKLGPVETPAARADQPEFEKISNLYLRAMNSFVPGSYDGKVFLLRETELPPELLWMDWDFGWSRVAKRLSVQHIPGGHFTALTDDSNLEILGARLSACLTEAEKG